MSIQAKSCYVRSDDKSLQTVYLPDSTPVFLGRCPETNIIDTKCSRQQVRLYANYSEYAVYVQQVGTRPCGLNGFKTRKDVKFVAKHGDRLEFLYGKYPYQIEFNPPPPKSFVDQTSRKRLLEPEIVENEHKNSRKIRKSEMDEENECSDAEKDKDEETKNVANIRESLNNENESTLKQNDDSSSNSNGKSWESIDNGELLVYTAAGVRGSTKVAAYDMDSTLIKTKSGLVFPKACDDWQLLLPSVPGKLKQLHSDGYKIVIFTNQGRIGSGKVTVMEFKMKIERIVQKIGVPIQVFIATGYNIYRKPAIGMWETLENSKNEGIKIDKNASFYVGDAAGRAKDWAPGKKKDHSFADRLLALNLGLRFQTPEEHFLGTKPAPFVMPEFNPKSLSPDGVLSNIGNNVTQREQEIILMVGCPASGKSHFAKHHLKEYEYVNRDTLGNWQKCVSVMEKHLTEGKRVVVDNTNPDRASRQRYIEVAKKYGVPVRCFVMTTSAEHAKHNNKFRDLTDPSHMKITKIIINSYMKNYVPPSLEEGFKEIVRVNFVPKFSNEKERKLYEMYLLEN